MIRNLALFVLMLTAFAGDTNAGDWRMGVDLYGRSYHHDLEPGERDQLNESNIGWGIHGARTEGRHRFVVEAGTFQNSYYDQAYWVGGQYTYRLFKYIEAGVMARHWETANNTYPEKPLNKYAMASIAFTDRLRLSAIVRPSGYVAFASYDFR